MTEAELSRHVAERHRVLDAVRGILIDKLHVRRELDEIDPDTPVFGTGLGLDSVDAVELLVCLDVVLGVQAPDDAATRASLRTVNTLVDLVLRHEKEPAHVAG